MKNSVKLVLAAIMGSAFAFAGLAAGGSESAAISLSRGSSKEVTLVKDSYSPEDGICYLKVTVYRKKSYTIWFEGGDAAAIGVGGVEIYPYEEAWDDPGWDDDFGDFSFDDDDFFNDDWGDDDWGDDYQDPPTADFSFCEQYGANYVSWMYAEDWENYDPSSWTYYICLSGKPGQKTTVHFVEGARVFLPAQTLQLMPTDNPADTAVEKGAPTEELTFGTEENLVFRINARAGVTYKLATSFVSATTDLPLSAQIFRLNGGREYDKQEYSIAPGQQVEVTSEENDAYYIRLVTKSGESANYPAFRVHALAYSAAGDLGLLLVDIKGPEAARWTLDSEETEYVSGDTVVLSGAHTLKFSTVSKDYNTPANKTVTVNPGRTPTVVEAMYTDKADHADDYVSGSATIDGKKVTFKPVSWSLKKNTETSFARTLWSDDPADIFTFDGGDGNYYDFELSDLTGDAVFSITNATPYQGNEGVFALNATKVSKLALPKLATKYYLVVHHDLTATDKEAGTYTISGSYATVGAIKFKSTALKVKEDAGTATLTVSRTASDGRVRVKYATIAGTAQPGVDYVAQSGILEWADGDKKDKTIVLKLIPDLIAKYEGNREFSVRLEPMSEDELEDDEYEAAFTVDKKTEATLDTATVTLTETAKASAGTVSVDCATPKKPVFDVRAGESFTLTLLRTDAADFAIEVKVDATSIGAGTQSVTWDKDDVKPKTVDLSVPAATDMKDTKKGTVRLTALSKDKPKFTASSVTVNVANDQFKQTVATWAKTLAKTDGVQVKEGASGTWFYMGDDAEGRPQLKHIGKASKLTLTLTGPCKLRYWIDGVEQESIDMMEGFVGKTKAWDLYAAAADEDVTVSYEYLYNNGDFDTILQTVKFGYDIPIADSDAKSPKVASGKLPDGVKLEQNKYNARSNPDGDDQWYVRGVPTKSGYYFYEIQDKDKAVLETKAVYVKAAGTAIGTFNGILSEDGSALTNNFPSLASVQLTVTSAGKLTAKVSLAGTSYSFSGTGFDEVDDPEADVRSLTASLVLSKKIGSETYENTLMLTIPDAVESDLVALGEGLGSVELTMAVPDTNNKGAQEDIFYRADLYRDNTKIADYVTAAAAFAGYYTVALPIVNEEDGKPRGNGYLTLTVDEKGKCKTAGKLVDDTSISSSLVPTLLGDFSKPENCTLVIPVFQAKKPAVFGGLVRLALGEDGLATVDPTEPLLWASDNAANTYEGLEGWKYEISPVGGWYDKVVNLQAYYINAVTTVDMPESWEFPSEILPSEDYIFETEIQPKGFPVEFVGNTMTTAKKSMVKDGKLYDLKASVNPCNVQIKFTRATGIVTGSFSLWCEDSVAQAQKELTGFKHTGILLFSRAADSILADEVITAGYLSNKAKVGKRTWTYSMPFNIVGEDQGEVDPWAQDKGWNPEWGEKPGETPLD